jgi:oligoribonuclease NrnB/cAMP/cGMP phosphodiesterase (DHH superfamily)
MIGINYGDEFPWGKIGQNETVFMVDFSLQPFGEMVKLWGGCDLVWIDHNISAIKDSESEDYQMSGAIRGLRRDGIGACQLCWEYFCLQNKTEEIDQPVPYGVKLLAEYDVWNHADLNTLPFQYGMRLEKTKPNHETMEDLWEPIFVGVEDFVDAVVKNGETVLRYVKQDNEKYCRAASFTTVLDGLRCIAVNKMLTNSQVFDSVWDPEKYDAMLIFGFRKGQWTVSLYTDKPGVDVSVIAKNRGGGGHKQASGFQCGKLPFFED